MKTTAILTAVALTGMAVPALAASEYEMALEAGGQKLTQAELSERLIGNTVTFTSAGSGDQFLVFYGEDNVAASRKVGEDATNHGFQAMTDRDQVCLGWQGSDLPALRCMDVLLIDGVMHKFKADGTLSGHVVETTEGNQV